MTDLFHRIRVFVYRLADGDPNYLLLKPPQGIEGLWGPIQDSLGFGEKLESAIRRKVMQATGMTAPGQLVDLEMPGRYLLGDEEIIEWNFGFHSVSQPDEGRLVTNWADFRWASFSEAYPNLGFEADRAAIVRLHTFLGAA